MWVALQYTSMCNAGKLSVVQVLDSSSATVTHTRTQTTDQLVDNLLYSSLVRNETSENLCDKLLGILGITLKVTVLRAILLLHSLERTHTAVALELTAVEDDSIARALLSTSYQ